MNENLYFNNKVLFNVLVSIFSIHANNHFIELVRFIDGTFDRFFKLEI